MIEAAALEVPADAPAAGIPPAQYSNGHVARETIESVIVAVVLAFLFRAFVAEAFVIPTGSMAPTLQGRHMDVVCSQCGHQYRTGASVEDREVGYPGGEVTRTRCPICRFEMKLDKERDANQKSFNGDRILVNKFAYQLGEPRRWDVIVFKYPGEAKVNYIKRLVGLPGETLRIRHGDIYTLDSRASESQRTGERFRIARKSPEKVVAMLQVVDDTNHVGRRLRDGLWPSRWTSPNNKTRNNKTRDNNTETWREAADGRGFQVAAGEKESWLRYRHLIPRTEDWHRLDQHQKVHSNYVGQLITDYYAYNDSHSHSLSSDIGGECWVGDLAVECEVEAESHDGQLLFDLVEGGTHYGCTIQLTTGDAILSIDNGTREFSDEKDRATRPKGRTSVRGAGTYSVRFANIDDQLFLWVNGRIVDFDAPTTFESSPNVTPQWSERDPGDLAPVGVAARNSHVKVTRLRVLRDVYYRAVEPVEPYRTTEYDRRVLNYDFDISSVMADPKVWSTTRLFAARRSVTFTLAADQFFPLGDNSPESRDARIWSSQNSVTSELSPPPYVRRELLIGKAVLVYWPHSWRLASDWFPIIPNFQRIGPIR